MFNFQANSGLGSDPTVGKSLMGVSVESFRSAADSGTARKKRATGDTVADTQVDLGGDVDPADVDAAADAATDLESAGPAESKRFSSFASTWFNRSCSFAPSRSALPQVRPCRPLPHPREPL